MTRLAGALLGAGFLLWIWGLRIIDPGEIGWVMHWYDLAFNFLGWHFFRAEPWAWPPGLITGYSYPQGTSIGLTDSIPLMALVLKPLQSWLPPTFQYFGLWLLICYALQGVFGVLLMRIWTDRAPLQIAGAAMFVLMPTLLIRVGHPSFCSHWLLLWALWITLRRHPHGPLIWEWGALGLLAGLINPYLAAMVLALLGAAMIGGLDSPWARRMVAMTAALVTTLGGWWLSGLFSVVGGSSLATNGFGYFSMNLLGPISPTGGWSRFLPNLPSRPGQEFEGFQYLGVGLFALLAVAVVLWFLKADRAAWRRTAAVTVVAFLMAIYALSPRVTLGSSVLVDLTGPLTERLGFFRSTGRFFWPLGYLILIFALASVVTHVRPLLAAAVLAGAVTLQMIDFHGAHLESRRYAQDPATHAWPQPMVSGGWATALAHYDHLVLYPPPQCGTSPMPYEQAAYVAGLHGLTINAGGVARLDNIDSQIYCFDLEVAMKAGHIDERSLYIMLPSEVAPLRAAAAQPVVCGFIDTLSVCVTASSYRHWRNVAPLD
jgi:hypothetical protein